MNIHNPLRQLEALGQSVWLDSISRGMLDSGELQRLIEEDGLSGITSNPTIFEKAFAGSGDYDQAIDRLAHEGKSAEEIFQVLEVEDIRRAADLLRPIYDRTDGRDGFASIEVSPRLARDAEATIAEAQRLWDAVKRPNIFVKVPATVPGLAAITRLLAQGINVNITLLFGLSRYYDVTQAYLTGLDLLAERERSLTYIASVASFFLSRIDTMIDPMLDRIAKTGGKQGELAMSLRGQVAVASAKAAWQIYKDVFGGDRFRALEGFGSRPQHLLWASTGTKNPAYSDIMYVDSIVARDTINTMTLETIIAYRDHGQPQVSIEDQVAEAYWVLERLGDLGIDLNEVTQRLEDEGVDRFTRDYEKLLESIERKRTAVLEGQPLQRRAA